MDRDGRRSRVVVAVILGIDTSTALTSVSVTDGADVIVELAHLDARKHAEVLAPMLRDVLAHRGVVRASISGVGVGVGPGPYTGLRVGIATALAVGAAWRIPVHGLCSLDAIAAAECATGPLDEFGVASDARRHEVYWAWYEADGTRREGPLVSPPTDIDVAYRGGRWLGAGALEHAGDFARVDPGRDDAQVHPHASWVGRRVQQLLAGGHAPSTADFLLAAHGEEGVDTSTALMGAELLPARPLYLRRPDATPSMPP